MGCIVFHTFHFLSRAWQCPSPDISLVMTIGMVHTDDAVPFMTPMALGQDGVLQSQAGPPDERGTRYCRVHGAGESQ